MNYKGKHWLRKRQAILRRDEYLCQECKRYGKHTQASMVHHINAVDTHPFFTYTDDNLISLCNVCHDKMHDRNNNELTDIGLNWVKRVNNKLNCTPPPII